MGVRPQFYLIDGVVFSNRQLNKINKIPQGKILLQWFDNVAKNINKSDGFGFESYIIPFVARDKDKEALEPIKYVWTDEKILTQTLSKCPDVHEFIYALDGYIDFVYWEKYNYLEKYLYYFPHETNEPAPIGFQVSESFGDTKLAYALASYIKADSSRIIKTLSMYPWETGIEKYKGKWHMCNAQAFLPEKFRKYTYELETLKWTSKEELIKKAKSLWNKYSEKQSYKNYEYETWYYSYSSSQRTDMLYKAVCKLADIKYDQKKLGRFIYINWC